MTATTAAATDNAATTTAHGPPREAFPTVRQFYWLLIMPATIAMIAFYFYPLSKVLWISVTEPEFGLGNYKRLLTSESIHQTLLATFRISVITTSVTLALGYVVAYAMVQATSGWLRWIMF